MLRAVTRRHPSRPFSPVRGGTNRIAQHVRELLVFIDASLLDCNVFGIAHLPGPFLALARKNHALVNCPYRRPYRVFCFLRLGVVQ